MEQWPFFVETGVGVRFGVAICSSGAGADLTLWFVNLVFFQKRKGRFVEPRWTLMSLCYDFLFGDWSKIKVVPHGARGANV